MTSSNTTRMTKIKNEIEGADVLSEYALVFFQQRFLNQLYSLVTNEYAKRAKHDGLKKTDIARRLGKDPAQITRWLATPGNLTLKTVSDLLIAMKCEPALKARHVLEQEAEDIELIPTRDNLLQRDVLPEARARLMASSTTSNTHVELLKVA